MRDGQKDLELCEKATPGPWIASDDLVTRDFQFRRHTAVELKNDMSLIAITGSKDREQSNYDARFIAESREALPYWIKRARGADELVNEIDDLVDVYFLDDRDDNRYQNAKRIKTKIYGYRGGS